MSKHDRFPENHKRRVSAAKKEAGGMRRAKDMLLYYDTFYGDFRDHDYLSHLRSNYDLFNGRLDVSDYGEPLGFNWGGERISIPTAEVAHYPMISQVANALYGEAIMRPFRPVARSLGVADQTARKKKYSELIREYLSKEVIEPNRQRIAQEYMRRNGVQDPFSLSAEDQQQMQQDIQQRTQASTPRRILDFMQHDFQTPTQRQAQQLLNYLVRELDIQDTQNEGFKHAIITGREVYLVSDQHGAPTFEFINPMYFQWGAAVAGHPWIQDGDWAKHEEWISFTEAVTRYSEHFKRGDWQRLEQFAEPIGGTSLGRVGGSSGGLGDPTTDPIQHQAMYLLSAADGYVAKHFEGVDVRTRAGQQDFTRLFGALSKRFGGVNGFGEKVKGIGDFGIRRSHVVYRDLRKLYCVTMRDKRGRRQKYFFDEHYEPTGREEKVTEIWGPEIWEGNILGSTDPVFAGVRRRPYQYRDPSNPFDVPLPYYGREYNTHMGNSRNIAPVDLGKPFQRDIDLLMAEIRHSMATDIGKVFVMVNNMKPDNVTHQEWFSAIKTGKVIHVQTDRHGSSPMDPTMLKGVDMSNMADIANKLSLLESLKNNLVQAMFFNPTRMGMQGQYATVNTVDANKAASFNQTEGIFETHRQIVEKALEGLVNHSKHVLRDQPAKLDFIFDDVARADLELTQGLWNSSLGVDTSLRYSEARKVEDMRNRMTALAQNGMSLEGLMELGLAETTSDIIDLFRKESRRSQEAQQQAMQAQQQQQQAEQEAKAQEKQMEIQSKADLQERQAQAAQARTETQVQQFRMQADVDSNRVADTIEKAEKEIAFKREQLAAETALKQRELDIKEKQSQKK